MAQALIFGTQDLQFADVVDAIYDLGGVKGFGQVAIGPALDCLYGALYIRVRGQNDHFFGPLTHIELFKEGKAVHARHQQIEQDDVELLLLQKG